MGLDKCKSNLRDKSGTVHQRAMRIGGHVLVACDAADESVVEWVPNTRYTTTVDAVTCRQCKAAAKGKGKAKSAKAA